MVISSRLYSIYWFSRLLNSNLLALFRSDLFESYQKGFRLNNRNYLLRECISVISLRGCRIQFCESTFDLKPSGMPARLQTLRSSIRPSYFHLHWKLVSIHCYNKNFIDTAKMYESTQCCGTGIITNLPLPLPLPHEAANIGKLFSFIAYHRINYYFWISRAIRYSIRDQSRSKLDCFLIFVLSGDILRDVIQN